MDVTKIDELCQQAGHSLVTNEVLQRVVLTIQSGEVQLPWFQEVVEQAMSQDVSLVPIFDLLMQRPEFIDLAWAYGRKSRGIYAY